MTQPSWYPTPLSPDWWRRKTTPDATTGCLLCIGSSVGRTEHCQVHYKGRKVLAHRLAYEQAYGPFDRSLNVCHRCDNPRCVNPDHLFLGTQKDNLRDMFAKGRARPHGTVPKRTGVTVAPMLTPKEWLTRCHTTSYTNKPERQEYGPQVPGWWRVVNVPMSRPTQAIVLYTPPLKWTAEPASQSVGVSNCLDSGAVLAGAL